MMRVITKFKRSSAWLGFFLGLSAVLAVDHWMRVANGWAPMSGISEYLYYGVPLTLGCAAIGLLWRATRHYKKWYLRLLELCGHVCVGFAAYAYILLVYVTGTGIDSL